MGTAVWAPTGPSTTRPTPSAPRLGVAVDLTGRATSVLRAFYGQLYSGATFTTWSRAVPGATDYIIYDVSPTGVLTEADRSPAENKYTVDPNIDHPRSDEFNMAFEQQLLRAHEGDGNLHPPRVEELHQLCAERRVMGPGHGQQPKTNQPLTIYEWANARDAAILHHQRGRRGVSGS